VILTWELPLAVAGGAIAGGGVFLIVRELLPATPALAPTLARLQPSLALPAADHRTRARDLGPWGFLARYVTIPVRDLAILGRGTDEYLTSLATSGLVGLLLPGVIVALLHLAGVNLTFALPIGVGLVCGLLFAFLAHRDVRRKATLARREFSRAFVTYLDLVVLELTAAGPVQAMEAAAKICHGWVFERIGDALTQAQLQMTFPWDQLKSLSEEIGVIELQDFASHHAVGRRVRRPGAADPARTGRLDARSATDRRARSSGVHQRQAGNAGGAARDRSGDLHHLSPGRQARVTPNGRRTTHVPASDCRRDDSLAPAQGHGRVRPR